MARTFAGRRLAGALMCLVSVVAVIAVPNAASAKPDSACFQLNNPRWATMRAMADDFVKDGTLTKEKAEAYKCDPRLAIADSMGPGTITIEAPQATINGCGNTAGIVYNSPVPTAVVSRQQLFWCWDGWTVNSWSGSCDGWATGWGSAIGWSFDGCVTNDYIPYTLAGRYPGGVHHYTKMKYSNITPWTPSQYLASSTWGHFDGTWDYAYH